MDDASHGTHFQNQRSSSQLRSSKNTDFKKDYKHLVQQMMYAGMQSGAGVNMLVPTEDYNLVVEKERKVDLSR